MRFSTLIKILVLAVGFAGAVIQYQKYTERREFNTLASQLAPLLDPSAFSMTTPKTTFDRTVFEAIALLFLTPGLQQDGGATTTPEFDRLVKSACDRNGFDSALTSIYIRTLRSLLATCAELEILDPIDRNLARMQSGLPPRVNAGIYQGDDLVVSFSLPPLAAPAASNQWPNVTLVPATVRSLRGDTIDTEAYRAAAALRSAKIISDEQFAKVEAIYQHNSRPPQ